MKHMRALIFLVVTGVIALHAIIPHEHHQSESFSLSVPHESESILDQIALGFHLGQLDGELEDMVFGSDLSIDHTTLAVLDFFADYLSLNLAVNESATNQTYLWVEPISELHYASLSQRGPPQV